VVEFSIFQRDALEGGLQLSLREFALVGLVKGDWDEIDATLDDILEIEMDWNGDWSV